MVFLVRSVPNRLACLSTAAVSIRVSLKLPPGELVLVVVVVNDLITTSLNVS